MEDNFEENNEAQNDEEHEQPTIHEFFEEDTSNLRKNINDVLVMLYELTKIDRELAEIANEKGDLPDRITGLKEDIELKEKHFEEDSEKLNNFENEEKNLIKENKKISDQIDKLDETKYKVRSNKEYDAIIAQIEEYMLTNDKNEARIKELNIFQEDLRKRIDETKTSLKEMKDELKEKQQKLDVLNKQYEDEETELFAKRQGLINKLDFNTKQEYELINSSYRGHAISIVRRENCSECFNAIPPQRVIEIKSAERLYKCQSCGRILIDESLILNL